jgi:FkbM family methyltransferase
MWRRTRHGALHAAIPLLRVLVRYGPGRGWREQLWFRVIEPYLAWHRHAFVARTRFGSRLAGHTDEILQQHIYYFGAWEPDVTDWVAKTLQPGDVMVDVGANAGYFSLLGSRLVGEAGAVVAVEASPRMYELLVSNLSRNRAHNVRAVNVAASDSHGTLALYAGSEAHLGLASVIEDQGAGIEAEVISAPLDAVLTRDDMQRARLIKIDVEGAELAVLAGLGELWDLGRDDLEVIVELHAEHLINTGRRAEDALDLFAERGFHAYELEMDYLASAYLSRNGRARPRRFRGTIDREVQLIFSHRDVEEL